MHIDTSGCKLDICSPDFIIMAAHRICSIAKGLALRIYIVRLSVVVVVTSVLVGCEGNRDPHPPPQQGPITPHPMAQQVA